VFTRGRANLKKLLKGEAERGEPSVKVKGPEGGHLVSRGERRKGGASSSSSCEKKVRKEEFLSFL